MQLQSAIDLAMDIQGMTVRNAMLLMAVFIEKLHSVVESGKIVEFGTYKGRVAALFSALARETDDVLLVDAKNYLEFEKFESANLRYRFFKEMSEDWCAGPENSGNFILSHHDASHYFDNVFTELRCLSPNLADSGLMILDDFSDTYGQVRAAYYYARYVEGIDFELLMTGFNKAILVHQDKFGFWEAFVLDELQERLKALGLRSVLSRTDINKLSRNFSIKEAANSEEPERYGLHIWGDRFYQRSSSR